MTEAPRHRELRLAVRRTGTAETARDVRQMMSPFRRNGAVAENWQFKPGFIYTTVRAISARVNQNYDAWPSDQLQRYHTSFLGKPIFVNHNNHDPERARGVVVASRYIDGGKDKVVETVMETDALRFPKLAHELRTGGIDSVSMGVEAGFTKCSICDNRATDVFDMCNHVKFHKGEYRPHAKTGKKTLVYEKCYKLGFFELSYVFDPADETAVVSRVIAANRRTAETYHGDGDVEKKSGPFAGPDGSFPVGTPKDRDDAKDVCNMPSVRSKHPGTCEKVDRMASQINNGAPSPSPDSGQPAANFDHTRQVPHVGDLGSIGGAISGQTFEGHWLRMAYGEKGANDSGSNGHRDWNMSGVRTRTASAEEGPSSARPVQGLLPASISTRRPGRGGTSIQTSAGPGLREPTSDWSGAGEHGRLRGDQGRQRPGGSWTGQLGVPPQVRHGADSRPITGAGRGSTSQESDSQRQPTRKSGAVDHIAASRGAGGGPNRMDGYFPSGSRRKGSGGGLYDAVTAPEDIDTLRDEGEDDDETSFHHYIESPAELQDPDLDQTKRLDRRQENQGLDNDRHSEDVEEFGARGEHRPEPDPDDFEDDSDAPMPIRPPEFKKSSRRPTYAHQGEPRMSRKRRYTAADEDPGYGAPQDEDPYGHDQQGGDDMGYDDSGDEDQGYDDQGGADPNDPDALVDEAMQDLDTYEQQAQGDNGGPDGPDSGGYGEYGESDGTEDGGDWHDDADEYDSSDDAGPDSGEYGNDPAGGGDDLPPWLQHDGGDGGPVNRAARRANGRGHTGRGAMRTTLASRSRGPRQHFADDNGHTDGGPYGVDDSQGEQEDVFISQVPGSEAVCAPGDDESNISNSKGNLVARRRQALIGGDFDPRHYEKLAEVVSSLPPEARHAMAFKMALAMKADNPRFNWRTFYTAAKVPVPNKTAARRIAEALDAPEKVDPSLPDTGASDLKGDDFESLALDKVETQPKDAARHDSSVRAFQAFDKWLHEVTGRTARQHGNANFIRRAAVSYANRHANPSAALQGLFPVMDYVLREARKLEGSTMRRSADQSLETAAPDGRIDVEAPVKNVTDAEAQASQFDLGDFAHNAGDQLADPVLDVVDGNAGTWAPDKGKEAGVKLATTNEAMRLAELMIAAQPNTYSPQDRFQLTARFETMRSQIVRDRTRLLEAQIKDNQIGASRTASKQKVATAVSSRGAVPVGLASRRTAASNRTAAHDPANDSLMFF